MPPQTTTSEDLTRFVGVFGIAEASIHHGRDEEDNHLAQQVARQTTLMIEEGELLHATTDPANVSATTPPSEEDPGSTPEECRQQAAGVLNEIQAMVATEIQTWERHGASCTILLEQAAGVCWSEECSGLEKEVLREYENLRKRVELCFNDVRVKTEGKLLSPQEQLIAELLDKNQKLESRLKEKEEEQEDILNTELARTNDELAMVKEDLEGQKTKIAVLEKELGAIAKNVGDNFAFGASAWNRYFGNVGEEPPLPGNIADLLESPCPFWSGKQIRETHLLVLIPSTVNGRPFSLDLLRTLMQNPTAGGNRVAYQHYNPTVKSIIGKKSVEQSYWILITREILPDSKSKTYEAQEALIGIQTYRRTDMDYKVSSTLEAATAILLTCYLTSGEILVGSGLWARCNDRIGGFQALVGHLDRTRGLQLCYGRRGASSKQGVLGCCEWK